MIAQPGGRGKPPGGLARISLRLNRTGGGTAPPRPCRESVGALHSKAISCTLDELAGPVELPQVKEQPPKKRGRPRKKD
jgi:hypothetical protein